jgi:hypothetical protein
VQRLDGVGEVVTEGKLSHGRSDHLDEEDAVLVGAKLAVGSEANVRYPFSVRWPHHIFLLFISPSATSPLPKSRTT